MQNTTKRIIAVMKYNRETAIQEVTNADGSVGYREREKWPSRQESTQVVQGVYSPACGFGYVQGNTHYFKSVCGSKRECELFYSQNYAPTWEQEVGEDV